MCLRWNYNGKCVNVGIYNEKWNFVGIYNGKKNIPQNKSLFFIWVEKESIQLSVIAVNHLLN